MNDRRCGWMGNGWSGAPVWPFGDPELAPPVVACMDAGEGREQEAVSFACMDAGEGREQEAVSFACMDANVINLS